MLRQEPKRQHVQQEERKGQQVRQEADLGVTAPPSGNGADVGGSSGTNSGPETESGVESMEVGQGSTSNSDANPEFEALTQQLKYLTRRMMEGDESCEAEFDRVGAAYTAAVI